MQEQWTTAEQVRDHLIAVFGAGREFSLYEFEYGWVVQEILSATELADGQGIGLEHLVVDRETGVVTAHTSLPPKYIGEQYDTARREGLRPPGYQVYPPTWEISLQRLRETAAELHYQIAARSLLDPPAEPPTEHVLTVDKNTFYYHTDSEATHIACSYAVSWAEERSRDDGVWPAAGTFRV